MQERLRLSKTKEEWDVIDKEIKRVGKSDLSCFLRGEIAKLNSKFENDSTCIIGSASDGKIDKQPVVPELSISQLRRISARTKKPISTIVNEFILIPLLLPDKPLDV